MIYSIKVKILQTFHLQSPTDSSHSSTPPPHSQTIFILDSSHPPNYAKVSAEEGGRSGSATPSKSGMPLKVLRRDEMWKVNHLARLPNDNHIRPSTHEGTKSPISVNHSVRLPLFIIKRIENWVVFWCFVDSNGVDIQEIDGRGREPNRWFPTPLNLVIFKQKG